MNLQRLLRPGASALNKGAAVGNFGRGQSRRGMLPVWLLMIKSYFLSLGSRALVWITELIVAHDAQLPP